MPTVGLNALFLDPGRSGGPETYLRGLVPEMARQAPHLDYVLATTRRGAAALREEGWQDLLRILELPADEGRRVRRLTAEQVLLPARARRERWALLHSLATTAPLHVPGVRTAITVHDMTFLAHRTFSRATTLAMRATSVGPARRADALIAISTAARDETCRLLGLDPARFTVVPNGRGRQPPASPADPAPVRARHGLEGVRVVLCVSAKRPHKNQEVLVRALPHLPRDLTLVLAGHPEPYEAVLRGLAADLGVQDRVRFPGYVDDAELEALWALADVAAIPSLAEGFGLPLLEAFERGVPVAASDIPVLHEVGGELPWWFDPRSPAAAAAAVERAAGDRSRLEAGRRRAAEFSWERAAEQTVAVHERVLGL